MIENGKPSLFGRPVKHPLLVLVASTAPLAGALARLAVVMPAHCLLHWCGRRGLMRDGEIVINRQSLERRQSRQGQK